MKYILMNKNVEVLEAEYNEDLKVFIKIYKIKNIDYAPVIIKDSLLENKNDIITISEWFKNRGIPNFRDDLKILLSKLNISTPIELLDKAYALSLSDQYWIKPYNSKIKYEDINFFNNKFDNTFFKEVTFSNLENKNEINLFTPNNTTDGRLKKVWIIENNDRYLIKGGYKNEKLQPFNEVLASMICNRLGFNHVEYKLEILNNTVVSKCKCFINENTEYVTAYQILHNKIENKSKSYEEYIKILESNGIKDARISLENMFILDYLMLNEDRHLNNFGIIRNVNTLKWISVAPIFDTGQSLNIIDYNDDEISVSGDGIFFYSHKNFDEIISNIRNIKRFDLTKLDGIVEEFEELLRKYNNITKISDRKINKLCTILYSRIESLKRIIEKKRIEN